MSQSAVSRIWRAFGLKPHIVETWKLSTDPQFVTKVRDVVGIYLAPPENALVLAVDEKSQIQALDRTQPVLPMAPATPAKMTHDYVRHGTTSLFAALDIASGSVIAQHYRRHRHQEFLRFLKVIDAAVPKDLDLHLVLDNYATHKTEPVKKWLLRHPRFHLHFTPTSASWLNLVERWFAELTNKKLRRGAHRSVREDVALQDELAVLLDLRRGRRQPACFRLAGTGEGVPPARGDDLVLVAQGGDEDAERGHGPDRDEDEDGDVDAEAAGKGFSGRDGHLNVLPSLCSPGGCSRS